MSSQRGKLITCDRCGESTFVKYHKSSFMDGGYTEQEHYDPTPEGWEWESGVGHLCPSCNRLFKETMTKFLGYDKTPEKWRVL